MRLEHVNLTVADLERSIAFYTELFDLEIRWRGHTEGGTPAVHVGDDHWYLALFEGAARRVPVDYGNAGFNHFGVIVDDLDAAMARLEALGAEVQVGGEYDPGRRAYTFDPDGHEIELVEYAPAD